MSENVKREDIMPFTNMITNQKGSVRHGLGLILVILILVVIFKYVDRKEMETREFGYSRDPDRFDETKEEPFFNDDEFVGQYRSREAYQMILQPIDDKDVEEEDPNMVGKSTQNSFYKPPSPEKRRSMDSQSTTPKLRP